MLRIIQAMSNTLKAERFSTFLTWKSASNEPAEVLSEQVMEQFPEVKASIMDEEEELSDANTAKFIEAESRFSLSGRRP